MVTAGQFLPLVILLLLVLVLVLQVLITISVASVTGTISVGNLVAGTGIGAGAKVSRVDGSTVVLTVANSGAVSGTINFTGGVTTATYPERHSPSLLLLVTSMVTIWQEQTTCQWQFMVLTDAAAAAAATVLNKGDNTDPCDRYYR